MYTLWKGIEQADGIFMLSRESIGRNNDFKCWCGKAVAGLNSKQ